MLSLSYLEIITQTCYSKNKTRPIKGASYSTPARDLRLQDL